MPTPIRITGQPRSIQLKWKTPIVPIRNSTPSAIRMIAPTGSGLAGAGGNGPGSYGA
jgi:hypothetical protein